MTRAPDRRTQGSMLKAFDLSVGVFVRGLTNLKGQLTKGEAHAAATGADPASLLHARLADDMYNLAVQTHWASEGAKLAVARLLGDAPAPLAEEGKTFAELHERIEATVAHLRGVDPEALEAGLERTIEVRSPRRIDDVPRQSIPDGVCDPELLLPPHGGLRNPPSRGRAAPEGRLHGGVTRRTRASAEREPCRRSGPGRGDARE